MSRPGGGGRLDDWLARLEARSPEHRIEPGLERVAAVLDRLPAEIRTIPAITVAGTNGKGSVIAYLEAIFTAAGGRPLAYTSPHLLRFNERVRIAGREADDSELADALDAVEAVRASVALTYFEHVTLAALVLAARRQVDLLLLEVGLGGRLDAVNVLDADVAVITSIGLDHREWLGSTRAAIAREKLGIARRGRPLVLGERRWPAGAADALADGGAEVLRLGRDFTVLGAGTEFTLRCGEDRWTGLRPGPEGRHQWANAACAVIAATRPGPVRAPAANAIRRGLSSARLPGRFQCLAIRPQIILDVAHNAAAARILREMLSAGSGPARAVFSALAGKDVRAIGRILRRSFHGWWVGSLEGPRGQPASRIAGELVAAGVHGPVETLESIGQALDHALASSGADDRVVVFGSFQTVAAAWRRLRECHLLNSDESNG